jgi:hypothetical protein
VRRGGRLVLVLVLLVETIVQANASVPLAGIIIAIRVPFDVAIVIIVGIFAAAAVLWGIAGSLHLVNRWRRRKRLISTRKESEQSFKKNLPWKIDSTTVMTDVAADGVTLTLTFTIDMSAAEMTPGSLDALKRKLAPAVFQRDAIVQNLKAGAIYQYRFIDQDGKVLGQLNLAASDFT